jgi:hypothetical protein
MIIAEVAADQRWRSHAELQGHGNRHAIVIYGNARKHLLNNGRRRQDSGHCAAAGVAGDRGAGIHLTTYKAHG